jgi:pyruvate,water dikinase
LSDPHQRKWIKLIGLSNVLARVKDCWASLYGERVLAYRAEQHLAGEPEIAVIIQKMILSVVMFTADPISGALDRMIIESVFGQGEAIVSGRVEPTPTSLTRQARS